jgi:hypothetical protein
MVTIISLNAWEKVSPNIISKCWHKILHKETLENPDSDYEAEDLIPLSTLRQNLCSISQELNDVGELLNSTVGHDIVITDEERDGWLFEDENLLPLDESLNTESNEDVPETEVLKTVTNRDAIKCFETCFTWAEENDALLSDLLVLQRLRENAYILNQKIVKQKKITDFFLK